MISTCLSVSSKENVAFLVRISISEVRISQPTGFSRASPPHKLLALYRERYFDLNVKHFHEKLQQEHQIELSIPG